MFDMWALFFCWQELDLVCAVQCKYGDLEKLEHDVKLEEENEKLES